jgi:antitoxin VapB
MNKITTAKLFMHGRSQAVRLPKEFRMEGKEVEVTRNGDSITLSPVKPRKTDWEAVFAEIDAMGPSDDYPDEWRNQRMLPFKSKDELD